MTTTTAAFMNTMATSAFLLLTMFMLINARLKQPRLEDSDTLKSLKQAAQDTDSVVNIISETRANHKSLENIHQPVSETLITEELDMLAEDAQKLRDNMLNAATGKSVGRYSGENLEDHLKNIQSDAASLFQDTEELISDVQYNRKQIKTHTDLTFDRDLELLRNQTGRVLDEVRNIRTRETDKFPVKKTRRKRKHRKKNKPKDRLDATDRASKQFRSNEAMLSDLPNSAPLWRDPRCDQMFPGRSPGDRPLEPKALTLARTRGNNFDVSWMMCYLQACPHCTASTQGSQCPLTNRVLDMKKWANELQEILTHGCVKPAGCTYPGTCCIAADAAIEQTIVQITDMLKNLYDMFHKKCISCYTQDPPGSWSVWSEWGNCDATCGRGTRSRSRRCSSGQGCTGMSVDTEPCPGLPDCCVEGSWSSWDNWAPCSVTCGRGQTTRSRRCSRSTINGCVKPCVGASDDIRVCEAAASCCVDGNWGTWSRWSACSSSCGDGRRTRTRTCSNPSPSSCGRSCPGDMQQIEPCSDSGSSVIGNWGSWLSWSACSASCGPGYRSRRRACDNPSPGPCGRPCVGSDSQTDACESGQSCCVDGNWAPWESWGSCSVTCGRGQTVRRRRCSRPAPNYCGKQCVGDREEVRVCEADKECCVDGNWAMWSRWSACSSTCGDGRRTRTRTCSNPPRSSCGQGCQGDLQQVESCSDAGSSVNGNWGSWLSWSACSATCGPGYRSRRRACDNPSPGPCGRPCVGSDLQTDVCDSGQSCCVDGNWGMWQAWSTCSATCDIGTRQRYRSCDNPSPNYCGAKCRGEELEMTVCVTGIPCRKCEVKEWTSWGSWGGCSATCGYATRSRSRSCAVIQPGTNCGSECPGRNQEEMQCVGLSECSVDGSWGSWQPWSQCSVTCGRGIIERRRRCDSPPPGSNGQPCPGRDYERKSCENTPCLTCVDGNWGSWHTWSPCSVTCDQGTRERRRSCDNPPPNECGRKCLGRESETGDCDTGTDCCIDGNWGSWQPWSPCSVSCGSGTRERRRSCDSPSANECGRKCLGREIETNTCDTGADCCVNGNWGPWQPWSSCSVTCDQGTIERRRSCDNPSPNECGQYCFGREFETNVCVTGTQCPETCVDGNWGSWQPWSPCSVSCGSGTRERRRSCDSPSPSDCGKTCFGREFETNACETGRECPEECVNGNWGSWSSWSACPVTCGEAMLERRRLCNNPPPNVCGLTCVGPMEDRKSERCGPPEIIGEWSPWSSWSDCSVSCGIGSRLRSRSCSNPPPALCGSSCPGQTDERVTCRGTGLCGCEVKEWTNWGPWSGCSATCGYATRSRSRACAVVQDGNDCGSGCAGSAQEDVQCVGLAGCAALDQWSAWSSCSVTCRGRGIRERFITTTIIVRRGDVAVETNETRRETQDCEITQPECPIWGQWSACSATCRGQGQRERIVSTSSGDIGTGEVTVESNATRKEVQPCEVQEPECPSWGEWSACSVTCRGQGFRERVISTSRIVEGTVETDAVRKEYENCSVTEPECPYGDAGWAQWDSWCPCDCRQGIRTRRRDCEKPSLLGDDAQKVPIALCQGEARDEEICDTRLQCPECILDCRGRPPGLYPSCVSCDRYVSCLENGNFILTMCSPDKTEFDAFVKKCVPPPSPSCTLHDCVRLCQDKEDGTYHACGGCNFFVECTSGQISTKPCPEPQMEWNQHTRKCERGISPTCKREMATLLSTIPGGGFMSDESTIPNCKTHCQDTKEGKYPSCRGCNYYVVCTKYEMLHQKLCPGGRQWDDHKKACRTKSSTCSTKR